jgi:hypothetical protein
MKASLFHKEKDANIFQQETFHQFRKEAMNQVNSTIKKKMPTFSNKKPSTSLGRKL